jgi:hypothetical protein
VLSRLNGRSFFRTIDSDGVDVISTLKFGTTIVSSMHEMLDVRYSFLRQIFASNCWHMKDKESSQRSTIARSTAEPGMSASL